MKLISLNVESYKHQNRVEDFLTKEAPDVICLQEVQPTLVAFLQKLQYTIVHVPMTLMKNEHGLFVPQGIAIASRSKATFESYYYYTPPGALSIYEQTRRRETSAQIIVWADVSFEGKNYRIGTTHFTWTEDGQNPDEVQINDMLTFSKYIQTQKPHIMCGDFNIPRNYNHLYEPLIQQYTDAVPSQYKSSLDKDLHRVGEDPTKAILFDSFMVDYIFTQKPYTANDVTLEFGISDHAAVMGTIKL